MARNLNFCFTSLSSPEHPPSLLIKNFNSLYESPNAAASPPSDHRSSSSSDDSAAAPDFASAFASRRFFFSSPGRSNSIIDSSSSASIASTSSSSASLNDAVSGGGGVAVPTYSPEPYLDFRRSMQEMVEARRIHDVRENWDYLHELLMSYLSLNPKSTHKFIVGAFADLLISLMAPPPEKGRRKSRGKLKISRQFL